MLPADSYEKAREVYGGHVWHMRWKYSDMSASARRSGPPPAAPRPTEEQLSKVFDREVIAGPSDQIVETLLGIREKAGVHVEFVTRSYFSTLGSVPDRADGPAGQEVARTCERQAEPALRRLKSRCPQGVDPRNAGQ